MEDETATGRANGSGTSTVPQLMAAVRAQAERARADSEDFVVKVWRPWDDLCVVSLAGELDMANAPGLTRALEQHLVSGPAHLLIELSALEFIDSSGINAFACMSRTLDANGGRLILVAPTRDVARIFEITKVGDVIPIVTSLEAALADVMPRVAVDGAHPDGSSGRSPGAGPDRMPADRSNYKDGDQVSL